MLSRELHFFLCFKGFLICKIQVMNLIISSFSSFTSLTWNLLMINRPKRNGRFFLCHFYCIQILYDFTFLVWKSSKLVLEKLVSLNKLSEVDLPPLKVFCKTHGGKLRTLCQISDYFLLLSPFSHLKKLGGSGPQDWWPHHQHTACHHETHGGAPGLYTATGAGTTEPK